MDKKRPGKRQQREWKAQPAKKKKNPVMKQVTKKPKERNG